jgi:hypothetical protein
VARSRTNGIKINGWLHQYWLAPLPEMKRLVRSDPLLLPAPRYETRKNIRWDLVAETASKALRQARQDVGRDDAPDNRKSWDVEVAVTSRTALSQDEYWVVCSLFSDPAIADFGWTDVTNGRHRIYGARESGAIELPIESASVSSWTAAFFGDDLRPRIRIFDTLRLHHLQGRCEHWQRRGRGADIEFIAGLARAIDYSDDWIEAEFRS